MSNIDWFFRDPRTAPKRPETVSQLYLLRRDIETCFGVDPDTGVRIAYQALWPGVMGILAGIDLLGKFLAGSDTSGASGLNSVGGRFTNFLQQSLNLPDVDSSTLYQLRNSLLHSFGLYSETRGGKVYKFVLTQGSGQLILEKPDAYFLIDVWLLSEAFNTAIDWYRGALGDTTRSDHDELTGKFDRMFRKHGGISI